MKMYVGNLPYDASDQELETLFGEYGQVKEVHVPTDRDTGRPRGFARIGFISEAVLFESHNPIEDSDLLRAGAPFTQSATYLQLK